MSQMDLKGDFGGWLDAQIKELDINIAQIDGGDDSWAVPRETFVQRRLALSLARCEFWEVIAR